MKKIYGSILMMIALLWSGCCPDGIVFSTQSQIDNFHNNYPDCGAWEFTISGDLIIESATGGEISNLNALNWTFRTID